MQAHVHLWLYLAEFFFEWEMFHTKVAEKIKTHTSRSVTYSSENCAILRDNMEKYGRARQATDGNNMANAHCMLDD